MAARKSANAEGVKSVKAVFTKVPIDGGSKFLYFRQPFNLVAYDWGNGERTTGFELALGHRFRSYTGEESECYEGIEFLEPSGLNRWPNIDRTDKVSAR